MKCEPKKKSFQWIVSEDKVLWLKDNKKLREACRNMKTEGLRKHKWHVSKAQLTHSMSLGMK